MAMIYGLRYFATIHRPANIQDVVGGFNPTFNQIVSDVPCDYVIFSAGAINPYGLAQKRSYKVFVLRNSDQWDIQVGDTIEVYDGAGTLLIKITAESVDYYPASSIYIIQSMETELP